jgi:hypothetical protein
MPQSLYILVSYRLPRAIGPFGSRLQASDYKHEAEASGIMSPETFNIYELHGPAYDLEPGL